MSQSISEYLSKIKWKDVFSFIIIASIMFVILKMLTGGILGTSLVVIENGPHSSMWPTYDQGDMFLIVKSKPDNIHMGDVIVYRSNLNPSIPDSKKLLIIHRVINITKVSTNEGIEYYYRVSGDNPDSNNYVDSYNISSTLIPYDAILGKTVFLIPKIGYLRLWLSAYPFIQYLVIGFLIIVLIYLILSPEEEKEKKEEKEEKCKEENTKKEKVSVKDKIFRYFQQLPKRIKNKVVNTFRDKKSRNKVIISVVFIISLIIFIPILDTIVSNRNLETGIKDISLVQIQQYDDGEIYFIAYKIYFSHDGTWNKVLKNFNITLIQNDKELAYMYWYSFYQKEGDLTIGGSIIVPTSDFNISQSFTISISYSIHLRFGHDTPYNFEKTFNT
ncbi:MAG: signal peptidase I [Candidatus Heimdallarchaeum endolithica]|uniref:Signal peptidase I n=1 Tax=Candidatus Heimdallarchaeum endolithica TaxID=2876572 RepID=A0A9Y1BQQ3_9ARCH|nr:MAG: signal peptidase I [Candidatus Heimdallarchaeum endolithica]